MLLNRQNDGISGCFRNVAYDNVLYFNKNINNMRPTKQYNYI